MTDRSQTQPPAHTLLRILEVSRRLATPFDLIDLLGQIIDAGCDVFKADRGSVFLYAPESRELFTVVAHGVEGIRFSVEEGIAGQCARQRETINVPDCYADPRFNQAIDRQTGYRTNSLIAVPLIGLDDELVGVMQLLNPARGTFNSADERLAELLASQAAAAIQRVRLLDERMVKLKMENDLALARSIQEDVFPGSLPQVAGYDLAGFSRPAEETGGDIYDVLEVDAPSPRLALLLADATGHGIGPALSVTQVRAMFRIGLRLATNLDDLVHHINAQLTQDLRSQRFVTAFVGMLDWQNHQVHFHAPGQGPLLHYQAADGACRWSNATTVPWGIMENAPMPATSPFELAPGDLLVLLTDGFYEYENPEREQFGPDRVGAILRRHHHESAEQILEKLLAAVTRFACGTPQADDLTAIVIKRESLR